LRCGRSIDTPCIIQIQVKISSPPSNPAAAGEFVIGARNVTAQILPFRKPSTPQVDPIMAGIAGYFIGLAIVGLTVIAVADAFMGGDTRPR
jgi:hypothetical protein